MSFEDCVNKAISNGELDPERGGRALELYAKSKDKNILKMGELAADAKSSREVFDQLKFMEKEKKRTAALMVRVSENRLREIKGFVNSTGEEDMAAGYRALFERHTNANYTSVTAVHDEILGKTNSIMNEVLTEFRLTTTGDARNTASFRNVVHEMFEGIDTGDAQAKNMAKAAKAAQEYVRQRYNAAGGRIPKKRGWGMAQSHDKKSLIDAGKKEWTAFILPRLAPEKMISPDTGKPMTKDQLELAVGQIYHEITENSLARESPDIFLGAKSQANKRLDHRFLAFKSSKEWLDYSERFGSGDPFSQLMSHVDGMARDIAQMETFGPNPTAMKAFLGERVKKNATALTSRGIKKKKALGVGTSNWTTHADKVLTESERMDDLFTGSANVPVNPTHAAVFSGLQSLHVASVLGSAFLSSVTDIATTFLTARAANLPMFKILNNTRKNFAGFDRVDRIRLSARLSLIMDNQTAISNSQMRYVGEVMGPQIMKRLAHTTLNLSFLSPMTKSWRWGFGQTFLGELHDASKKGWDDLMPGQRQTMERYGITSNDWKNLKTTKPYDASLDFDGMKSDDSTKFFDVRGLSERKDLSREFALDLSGKISRMIAGETEFAIPTTTLRGRAIATRGTRPGTLEGSAWRSVGMYKSYTATFMLTHMERAYSQKTPMDRAKAFSQLFLSTTSMGALALQMKDISKGKDPRQMFDENGVPDRRFLGAAITQGGGLGIFGDLFFADLNRFGRDPVMSFLGPGAGLLKDVGKFTLGNVQELLTGEDTNAGKEFAQYLKRYLPGQSLWYSRLALERLLFDNIQELLDDKAGSNFRRRERTLERDFGQSYWWKAGQNAPNRAPNFENIKK